MFVTLLGITLPYFVVAIGWWIASLALAGRRDDSGWDTAGTWIFVALLIALGLAGWRCRPVFRLAQNWAEVLFLIFGVILYLIGLFVFSLYVYTGAGGPFP